MFSSGFGSHTPSVWILLLQEIFESCKSTKAAEEDMVLFISFFQLLDKRWKQNVIWPEKLERDVFPVKYETTL
jgi:hypothetical protein